MIDATGYLEALRTQEVAEELRSQGYSVSHPSSGKNKGFNLVARKNGQKIALHVKALSRLRDSAKSISELRERARNNGFEFRLVVVNPPRETPVQINGLRDNLFDYLVEHVPAELIALARIFQITDVRHIQIDAVDVAPHHIHVVGRGVVEIEVESTEEELGQGADRLWKTDFSFIFDLLLNERLEITQVNSLTVDTSSFEA